MKATVSLSGGRNLYGYELQVGLPSFTIRDINIIMDADGIYITCIVERMDIGENIEVTGENTSHLVENVVDAMVRLNRYGYREQLDSGLIPSDYLEIGVEMMLQELMDVVC